MTEFLSFWALFFFFFFLPFYPLIIWKIKILGKWKNHLEMSSFYTCVPKIKIIWCMLPEILYGVWQTQFLSFKAIFCPFTPLKPKKIKNFEKMTKKPGNIIILHMCTINDNHMIEIQSITDIIFCHFGPSIFNLVSFEYRKVQICVLMTKWKDNWCNITKYSSFKNSVPKQYCSQLVSSL